ncbi:MAG: hypothetical protein IJY39_12265 [Clostridia bacterium]|nr:hypothetical protein [Clostridia bacterium]
MNAYYQRNNKTTLVTDTNLFPQVSIGNKLISLLCAIVAMLTSSVAVKIEKAVVCTVVFFAFFGIIGSMEAESIGMLGGLLLCGLCTLVEFLVFKSMFSKKSADK